MTNSSNKIIDGWGEQVRDEIENNINALEHKLRLIQFMLKKYPDSKIFKGAKIDTERKLSGWYMKLIIEQL